MVDVTMTMEEYLNLLNGLNSETSSFSESTTEEVVTKPKRKASAYSKRYKSNFKKVSKRFKLKNGKWAKGGFKKAVKMAHKLSKK